MKMDNKRGAAVIAEWPKRVPLSTLDKLLMLLTLAVLLAPIMHLLMNYGALPAEIATEYQGGAVVETEREAKWFLLILAGADVLCTLSVLICLFFPGAINVPPALLKRPALEIIRGTRVYLCFTAIACAVFFGYMLEVFLRCAGGTPTEMSGWAIGAFVVLIFGSMGVYFYWLWKGDGPEKTAVPPRSKLNTEAGKIIGQWPKRLPLSLLDKIMIGVSALLVVLALARLAMVYGDLPEIIPSHYGLNGEVDGTSGKSTLLILGGVDVLCWATVVAGNFFPQAINVPVFLLRRSGEEIIQGSRVLLNVIAILCTGLFWYLLEATVQIALGSAAAISNIVMFGFMGALILACLIYFFWLWRA